MTRQMIVRSVFLLLCLVSLSKGVPTPDETPAAETKDNVTEAEAPAEEAETSAKEAEAPAEAPAKEAEAPAKDPETPANETTVPEKEVAKGEIKTKSIEGDVVTLPLRMPDVLTTVHDMYLVTPVKVDYDDAYIVGYVPQASAERVHHILIYGCTKPAQDKPYWDVGDMGGICHWSAEVNTILWAWALDAPKFDLPDKVGFHVGRNAKIDYILLQVHYKYKLKEADNSGVDVILITKPPPKLAGIYLFATGGTVIPPRMSVNADTTCAFQDDVEITPFAYRTHTHKLGVRVSGWREREGTWTLLGTGNPQKPQMFYLMKGENHPVRKGDILHARCEFVSTRDITTRIGSTGEDEMCNFYMMYFMDADKFRLEDGCYYEKKFTVPDYARVKEEENEVSYEVDDSWKSVGIVENIGQIGGLSHSADKKQLVVFHRAGNDWSKKQWFDYDNVVVDKEAILEEDVILFIDPISGNVTRSLGKNHFIMPHGVFVDHHDNVFVTDVALHQVLKFEVNKTEPSLILGTKFEPGNDSSHFCKPTSVVVTAEDFIFVGDGYCNSRVVKFNKRGIFVGEFGKESRKKKVPGSMGLVHDLAINHPDRMIYVADRENGQIHTMTYKGNFTAVYSVPGSVYAIDYIPESRLIAAVNISDSESPAKVMLVNVDSGEIKGVYPCNTSNFTMPHALTYIQHIGIFLGEITAPFHVWKLSEKQEDTEKQAVERL
ncbi:peptidylglycine alpha-amidating monooxygenase-like isoform X2 [Bolinopsis microptera]|uniref:peptidylglycine alpha-amidating monooxygenase-like isoform X2 n=1 Tax=Bolinopsis microptera TaxID=2820187 RepID=UPI0030797AB5